MAVGLERTHAKCVRAGESLMRVEFGLLDLRRLAMRDDLPQQAQGIRLVALLLLRPCDGA